MDFASNLVGSRHSRTTSGRINVESGLAGSNGFYTWGDIELKLVRRIMIPLLIKHLLAKPPDSWDSERDNRQWIVSGHSVIELFKAHCAIFSICTMSIAEDRQHGIVSIRALENDRLRRGFR
jgi:hypothetical protein